jgi:hypothetical protein
VARKVTSAIKSIDTVCGESISGHCLYCGPLEVHKAMPEEAMVAVSQLAHSGPNRWNERYK